MEPDYAFLLICGIIAICVVLSYLSYKIDGSGSAIIAAGLSIGGAWISIGVVNVADFNDGSPETILTICIGTVTLPLIYNFFIFSQRASQKKRQKENYRLAEVGRKVNAIIHQYSPQDIGTYQSAALFKINPSLLNKEIIFAVKTYKERTANLHEKYSSVAQEIEEILSCPGCQTVDEKYSYLTLHTDWLKTLKRDADDCLTQLASLKIEILNDDRDLLFEMKLAFHYLRNSKKCLSETGSVKDFITPLRPKELILFRFENEPIILFIEQFYFCLFSNVILVFDNLGVFSTAIDPSALKIVTRKEIASITLSNGNATSNQYIDEDSRCVSQGTTRSTWLHTCLDGTPDRRYSYNPRMEYRTDTYEYVVIEFAIANLKISFSASSCATGDAFEKSAAIYTRQCNNRHNTVPELLQLMKILCNNEDAQIDSMMKLSTVKAEADGYFCRLIPS